MTELSITPGGKLIYKHRDKELDGSHASHKLLFDTCHIEEGVTLRDIFTLVSANISKLGPILGKWTKDYVAEALSEPPEEHDSQLERLELYWVYEQWDQGAEGEVTLEGTDLPRLHGIGADDGGSTVQYAIDFTRLNALARLPVVLNREVTLYSHKKGAPVNETKLGTCEFTLADILIGIYWEVSFHGSPKARDKRLKEIEDSAARIKSGEETLIPLEDIFPPEDRA